MKRKIEDSINEQVKNNNDDNNNMKINLDYEENNEANKEKINSNGFNKSEVNSNSATLNKNIKTGKQKRFNETDDLIFNEINDYNNLSETEALNDGIPLKGLTTTEAINSIVNEIEVNLKNKNAQYEKQFK